MFNKDAYVNFFRRIFGKSETRHLEVKEVVMNEVELPVAFERIDALSAKCAAFAERYKAPMSYIKYWTEGYDKYGPERCSYEEKYEARHRECKLLDKLDRVAPYGTEYYTSEYTDSGRVTMKQPEIALAAPVNVDSIFRGSNPSLTKSYLKLASNFISTSLSSNDSRLYGTLEVDMPVCSRKFSNCLPPRSTSTPYSAAAIRRLQSHI